MKSIAERVYPGDIESVEAYVLYLKHLFAYDFARSQIKVGCRILDVGSGEGYGTPILAGKDSSVVGVDIDQETVKNANERYGSANCRYMLFDGVKTTIL